MESATIRITLTNGKGWRETKNIDLYQYLANKEKDINLLDKTLEELMEAKNKVEVNMEENKLNFQNWRH